MSVPIETSVVPRRRSPARAVGGYTALVLAGAFLLLTSFAVWVDRVVLDTGVFVDTSGALIEDDEIRQAVARRAVDELYASVDVETVIEGRLPGNVKSLAGPTAAGLREVAPNLLDRALEQPALRRLWAATLEQTHRELVDVLEGGGRTVSTEAGVVTLDLRQLVLEAAERIGIRRQVEARLPATAGRIEVLRSDELDTAQDGFQLLNTLAWVLPLLTLAAFALVLGLARDRQAAIRAVGVTLVVVGVIGLVVANLTGNYLVDQLVAERDAHPAADNAWGILTDLLRGSFRWIVVVGVLFVVAAWLAGTGPRAATVRRALAPALAGRIWPYLGLAVVGLVLLLTGPASDFSRFLVLAVLLGLGIAWIELTRAQALREFPAASGTALVDEARALVSSWWQARQSLLELRMPRATPRSDLTASLVQLADLHARDELTDEEYAAAKARVLAGE